MGLDGIINGTIERYLLRMVGSLARQFYPPCDRVAFETWNFGQALRWISPRQQHQCADVSLYQ